MNKTSDRVFLRTELDKILPKIINKTFEEVDKKNLFETQKNKLTTSSMDKGIFGKVIEYSVLDMNLDQKSEPDIDIDYKGTSEAYRGIEHTEIKTTGLIKKKKSNKLELVPKERVSVTAVSIGNIEKEDFDHSAFWHKIEHLLWIFYEYKYKCREKKLNERTGKYSYKNIPYSPYEQRYFVILNVGYQHMKKCPDDYVKLQHDWQVIHDYLVEIQDKPQEDKEKNWWPMLHTNTKANLWYVDIAPRYPNNPRLAFKSSYVTTIYDTMFRNGKYEVLDTTYSSYDELNTMLHDKAELYAGKRLSQIANELGLEYASAKNKNLTEAIALALFDDKIKKLNKIDIFCKAGIICKTITLNNNFKNTENGTKLFTIDLEEFSNPNIPYEESNYYEYFSSHRFLFIVFQEKNDKQSNDLHKFLGFKWLSFDDLLYTDCIRVWEDARDKIINDKVEETYCRRKKDNSIIYNKTKTASTTLNFPKSSEGNIFFRGTGNNSTNKAWIFNGKAADGSNIIHAYSQQVWIKGQYIAKKLMDIDYI